jgi:acyl-CoA synthetase (AMP-forming)/AMP-acid ligase II
MLIGYRRLEQEPPVQPVTLAALLRECGTDGGQEELAFRLIDRTTDSSASATFGELYRRSGWVARELARHRIGPSDVVVLFLDTCLEFTYGLFGAVLQGALPVAVAPPLSLQRRGEAGEHLERMVRRLGARVILTSRRHGDEAARVASAGPVVVVRLEQIGAADDPCWQGEKTPPDAPVLLQLTSGTLGAPKPIALSARSLFANLAAVGDAFTLRPGDVGMSWLPLYHDMGLQSVFFSLMYRMPLVLMAPTEFLHRPAAWLRGVSRYGVTHSPAPPFGYGYAADRVEEELAGIDLSRWRVAMCGADIIHAQILERFARRFERHGFRPSAFMPAYGLAENTVAVSFGAPDGGVRVDRPDEVAREALGGGRPGGPAPPLTFVSVGQPIAGHRVRVVDAGGGELPDGTQGEIEVAGPSQMLGYWGEDHASGSSGNDGWLRTGDLGYVRHGELFVTGIGNDLIPHRGRNCHAHLIEAAATVPGAQPGGVVAMARRGPTGSDEVLIVAETLGDSSGLAEAIRRAVDAALGVCVGPVLLVRRGSVPRTTSGKLRRAECRRRWEAG